MKRRVIKVGGSLLELDGLVGRLELWLQENSDMQNVVVVGGGRVADLVRMNQNRLTDEQSHRLAIRAMSMTVNLISQVAWGRPPIREIEDLLKAEDSVAFFDTSDWILEQPNVPSSWNFTSDSIAARLASVLEVDELVLLKSRMGKIEESGFVDDCFATESKPVNSVRVCTLNQ